MATPAYQAGYPCKVAFQPAGGSSTDINIQSHEWTPKVEPQDTTSSGSGGVEEWINGLIRGDGSFSFVFDTANKFYGTTPGVREGVHGIIKAYVSATLFFTIPCGITQIAVKSVVAGKVEIAASYKLDSASGAYSYPA